MSNGDTPAREPSATTPTAEEHKTDAASEAVQSPTDSVAVSTEAAEPQAAEPQAAQTQAVEPQAVSETGVGSETVAGRETTASASPTPAGPANKAPLATAVRGAGPLAARGLGIAKPASPSVNTEALQKEASQKQAGGKPGKAKKKKKAPLPRVGGKSPSQSPADSLKPKPPTGAVSTEEIDSANDPNDSSSTDKAPRPSRNTRVAVPSVRAGLDDDLQAELDAELAAADVEQMLSGNAGMADRKGGLAEGGRVHATVLKIHNDSVFVGLGGPDEGVVPFEQFDQEPVVGAAIEVIVRGFNSADGLYALGLPGAAVEVSEWEDIDEGAVVEATVTASNAGGLECKVGGMKGFIPISQIADHRVEDTSEFVDQKFLCVVTESNERRGNLVLSRRAILEREREEKRKEQLENMEVGSQYEGVVRSVKDFGAFVDLGGCDGLIHISKLSWDRVKHPSEVLEVGQKVQVKVDKVDKETGKISLSYRDLLENPWDTAEAEFAVGSVHKGVVTRTANFGCFVKLGPGVEGLVHVSELAHHRVSKVDAFINEGDEVEVKVVSFDREAQKVGLSIKAAQSLASDAQPKPTDDEIEEPQREPAIRASHSGPLKGGNNQETGGEKFGLRW